MPKKSGITATFVLIENTFFFYTFWWHFEATESEQHMMVSIEVKNAMQINLN